MTRLLPILFCGLIGISLSMLNFHKKEADKECEENPEASPVSELTINSGKQINIRTEDLVPGFYLITFFEGNKMIYQTKGIRTGK